MNKDIMKEVGFEAEVRMREKACCPCCGNQVNESDFYDELSKTEFKISGLCQSCQDDFFTDSDDDEIVI